MVQDFVSNMLNDNIELRKHCASAIFKCAQEEETRALGIYTLGCSISTKNINGKSQIPLRLILLFLM